MDEFIDCCTGHNSKTEDYRDLIIQSDRKVFEHHSLSQNAPRLVNHDSGVYERGSSSHLIIFNITLSIKGPFARLMHAIRSFRQSVRMYSAAVQ